MPSSVKFKHSWTKFSLISNSFSHWPNQTRKYFALGWGHVLFKYENNLHIFSLDFLLYYFQSGWEPILKETASKMFGHRTKNAMDYVYKGKDFHKTYQLVYAFTKAGIQVGKIFILYFLPSWLPYNSSVLDKWRTVLEKKLFFPPL